MIRLHFSFIWRRTMESWVLRYPCTSRIVAGSVCYSDTLTLVIFFLTAMVKEYSVIVESVLSKSTWDWHLKLRYLLIWFMGSKGTMKFSKAELINSKHENSSLFCMFKSTKAHFLKILCFVSRKHLRISVFCATKEAEENSEEPEREERKKEAI